MCLKYHIDIDINIDKYIDIYIDKYVNICIDTNIDIKIIMDIDNFNTDSSTVNSVHVCFNSPMLVFFIVRVKQNKNIYKALAKKMSFFLLIL